MNVTCYNKLLEPDKGYEVDVYSVFENIRNGKVKDQVEKIRAAKDKKKRDELKRGLPGVCFGGTFSHRKKDGLIQASGLAILDFDNLANAEAYKTKLKTDPYIFAAWISPSGTGVKCLLKIPHVTGDEEYKKYYNAILLRYKPDTPADSLTKDISRFSFDSYDPTLWTNEACKKWEEQYDPAQVADELPVLTYTDTTDGAFEKLQTWINKRESYSVGNRNNYIFIFASACNRYGIPKQSTIDFLCSNYDLDSREIITTVSSAYKDTRVFGSAKFENTDHFSRAIKNIADGKAKATIRQDLIELQIEPDIADKIIENAEAKLKDKIETFWSTDMNGEDVKIYFEPEKYINWLSGNGFHRYAYTPGDYVFIRIDNNKVKQVFVPDIRAFVFTYVSNLPARFDLISREQLYKYVFNNNTKFFSDSTLEMLTELPIKFLRDTPEMCYLFFRNCIVRVERDGKAEQLSYGKLDGVIWESQIIDRHYTEIYDFAAVENCEFLRFIRNILGGNEQNIVALMSVVGYMIHDHKNRAYSPAVILNDKKISNDDAEGGTGKGIFCQLFRHYRNVVTFDGKTWSIDKSFAFQRVDLDTKIIIIDDIQRGFDFEKLFSVITEGIPVEKKNKQEFFIPFEQSPKVICNTNYAIKGKGSSHERRRIEFEFESYYTPTFTPLDDFGHLLFDGWSQQEWELVDNFVIRCISFYLGNRITKPENHNLKEKIFEQNTCHEFKEWCEECLQVGTRYNRKIKMEEFNSEMGMRVSMKAFSKWLGYYAKYLDCTYDVVRTGAEQAFYFELVQNGKERTPGPQQATTDTTPQDTPQDTQSSWLN